MLACSITFPPRTLAIGHTFGYTFDLPKPDNAGNRSSKAKQKPSHKPPRKNTSKSPQRATSRVGKSVTRPKPSPAEVEAKRGKRLKYDRRRKQPEKRKEYERRRAQVQRQKDKEIGLCKSCPSPAIPGRTRCQSCADKHQESKRHSEDRQRAMAGQKPTEGL